MRISDWSSDVCSSDLLAALFYVSNWAVMAGEAGFDHINHLWSLSVEEQFYIVWPVVLMVAGRRALPVALLGIVASAALRAHLYDGVWLDVYRDPKRGVSGKGGAGSVDSGGRRIVKKK